MKNQLIRMTITIFLLILVTSLTSVVVAAPTSFVKVNSTSVQLVFDGKNLTLPDGQYIFSVNNSTYVPLRFVSYALQKSVSWDSKTQTVSVKEPTKSEAVVLKEYLINAAGKAGQPSAKGGKALQVSPVAAKFTFDGKSKALPKGLASYMLNGTIYVPVRFISESVGKTMLWDPTTGQIKAITKSADNGQSGSTTDETSNTGSENEIQTGGTTGQAGTGGASSGGAATTKPTYGSITSSATSQLGALLSACQAEFEGIKADYYGEKINLLEAISKGNAALSSCDSKFETIVSNTEAQLVANGYSTAIITDYRAEYQKQKDKYDPFK